MTFYKICIKLRFSLTKKMQISNVMFQLKHVFLFQLQNEEAKKSELGLSFRNKFT